jgi:two-component system chemotaxis response regulator CheB
MSKIPPLHPGRGEIAIVIGASTGGTEAIATLLQAMPHDAPGIAIVQHMPAGFTAAFAGRLNTMCEIEVVEGRTGDKLRKGTAIIAPGDKHMLLHRGPNGFFVETTAGPLVSRHRPSCDVLFRSAARCAGNRTVGVILTGMGSDGAEGMLELRNSGAKTIAQSEASCVVYGMPKAAVELGGIDESRPLYAIAPSILRLAGYRLGS